MEAYSLIFMLIVCLVRLDMGYTVSTVSFLLLKLVEVSLNLNLNLKAKLITFIVLVIFLLCSLDFDYIGRKLSFTDIIVQFGIGVERGFPVQCQRIHIICS